jgi:hypothetical protein
MTGSPIGQLRWVNNGKSFSFKLFSSEEANQVAWRGIVRRRISHWGGIGQHRVLFKVPH